MGQESIQQGTAYVLMVDIPLPCLLISKCLAKFHSGKAEQGNKEPQKTDKDQS